MAWKNKYYDRVAAVYERRWRKFSGRTHQAVLDALPADISGRVLDIGCGTGALLEKLVQLYPDMQAYGVDTSEAMLTEAGKKLGGRATLQVQTSNRLPEFVEPFDVVISSNVLHYIENPTEWLSQIRQVLKPGGLLILQDFSRTSRAMRYGCWLIRRIDEGYKQAYTGEEAKKLLADSGLIIQTATTFPVSWWWHGWLVFAVNRVN